MSKLPEAPMVQLCAHCRIRVLQVDVLKAPHPFIDGDFLFGCPSCREVDTLEKACALDGCTESVCQGTPGVHGYRYAFTCRNH